MTPLDFIASLEHGEAKAAALTVFNLMSPKATNWTTITDDPATYPPPGIWVLARCKTRKFLARWGDWPDSTKKHKWRSHDFNVALSGARNTMTPTHWRPIG